MVLPLWKIGWINWWWSCKLPGITGWIPTRNRDLTLSEGYGIATISIGGTGLIEGEWLVPDGKLCKHYLLSYLCGTFWSHDFLVENGLIAICPQIANYSSIHVCQWRYCSCGKETYSALHTLLQNCNDTVRGKSRWAKDIKSKRENREDPSKLKLALAPWELRSRELCDDQATQGDF